MSRFAQPISGPRDSEVSKQGVAPGRPLKAGAHGAGRVIFFRSKQSPEEPHGSSQPFSQPCTATTSRSRNSALLSPGSATMLPFWSVPAVSQNSASLLGLRRHQSGPRVVFLAYPSREAQDIPSDPTTHLPGNAPPEAEYIQGLRSPCHQPPPQKSEPNGSARGYRQKNAGLASVEATRSEPAKPSQRYPSRRAYGLAGEPFALFSSLGFLLSFCLLFTLFFLLVVRLALPRKGLGCNRISALQATGHRL